MKKKDEWLDFCANQAWTVTNDDKKNGYCISQCVSPGPGLPCMKSTGIFDFPLMQVFCCLHNANYRPIYDTNIELAKLLKKVACNTYMQYQKTKGMMGVSSRDLVLLHHVSKVQHPTLCPNGGVLILAFTPNPE